MEKYVGYELKVRVTFPAESVEIERFLEDINATGIGIVQDVVVLNSVKEEQNFLRDIG
jgi:hypothetical protein